MCVCLCVWLPVCRCVIAVAQNQVSTDNLSKLPFFRYIRKEVRSEEMEFNAKALNMWEKERKRER